MSCGCDFFIIPRETTRFGRRLPPPELQDGGAEGEHPCLAEEAYLPSCCAVRSVSSEPRLSSLTAYSHEWEASGRRTPFVHGPFIYLLLYFVSFSSQRGHKTKIPPPAGGGEGGGGPGQKGEARLWGRAHGLAERGLGKRPWCQQGASQLWPY